MARGAEAKLRRRNKRKEAKEGDVIDMFGTEQGDDEPQDVDDDDDSTDDDDNLPKQKKKTKGRSVIPPGGGGGGLGGGGGIKRTPLILLIMMVGTTVLPGLIFAGDYLSSFLAKNNVAGSVGYRLGIGQVPRKRVLSFYEKHSPEKLNDVPKILSKHYGQYDKLIKKLERKYQDYGYFLGWEEDEAPMRLALDQLSETYNVWITKYWNKYAPQLLKTGARNIRYNITFLIKKFRKLWKRHVWPMLEPILGVPKGADAQKRKDAAEARKRRAAKTGASSTGGRKNFRDDVED